MNESEGWLAKEIAPIEGILQPLVRPLPLAFRLGLFGRRSYAKSHSGRRPSAGQGDKQTSAACPSVNLSDCPFYFICPCTLPLHKPYVHSIQPSLHSICHHRRSLSDGPGDPFLATVLPNRLNRPIHISARARTRVKTTCLCHRPLGRQRRKDGEGETAAAMMMSSEHVDTDRGRTLVDGKNGKNKITH